MGDPASDGAFAPTQVDATDRSKDREHALGEGQDPWRCARWLPTHASVDNPLATFENPLRTPAESWLRFTRMKWIWVIVLVIIGVLAAIVAVEYLTVSIHALPSFIPGRHKGRGHYHKRGAVAALIAFVAFVIAGYLTYRNLRARPATTTPTSTGVGDGSADQLLSSPTPESGPVEGS